MPDVDHMDEAQGGGGVPNIGDFLWRPRYAKLWWAAIPIYWLGMAGSSRFSLLAEFYESALAGFLIVFFFPPMVVLILCFGFFREWLETLPLEDFEPSDEMDFGTGSMAQMGPSGLPAGVDPLDPRSGTLWIGNPLNPNNPIGFNRVS